MLLSCHGLWTLLIYYVKLAILFLCSIALQMIVVIFLVKCICMLQTILKSPLTRSKQLSTHTSFSKTRVDKVVYLLRSTTLSTLVKLSVNKKCFEELCPSEFSLECETLSLIWYEKKGYK